MGISGRSRAYAPGTEARLLIPLSSPKPDLYKGTSAFQTTTPSGGAQERFHPYLSFCLFSLSPDASFRKGEVCGTRSIATMDLSDVSIETDQIREWRSIITLIVFLLASKHTETPASVCHLWYAGSR